MQISDSLGLIMSTKLVLKSWTALRAVGPYVLIELLLPGGTLFAFLLWLSQRCKRGALERRDSASSPRIEKAIGAELSQVPGIASIKPLGAALR